MTRWDNITNCDLEIQVCVCPSNLYYDFGVNSACNLVYIQPVTQELTHIVFLI